MEPKKRVAVLIYDGVELVDMNGPIDVFIHANRYNNDKLILSVCIGAFSLAKTGILAGKKATTHYLSIPDLHHQYPEILIVKNVRFVEDGRFVTTAGVNFRHRRRTASD